MLDTNAAGIQVNSLVSVQAPLAGTCVCTAANTNYSAPTSQVLVPTQTRGARLTKVTALTLASVSAACELQLFASADGGTTKRFIDSNLMPVTSVAQTAKQTKIDFGYSDTTPLILLAGESLYAAIGSAQTGIVFRAEGGSY